MNDDKLGGQRRLVRAGLLALLMIILSVGPPTAYSQANDSASQATEHIVGFDRVPPGLTAGTTLGDAPVTEVNPGLGFAVLEVPAGDKALERLQQRSDVRFIEPNHRFDGLGLPDDAFLSYQWALPATGTFDAWSHTQGSSSVSHCLVDSGLRDTHEEFPDDRIVAGTDIVNGDSDPWDDHGHGTRMAGVALATRDNGHGIAGVTQAGIMIAKVISSAGYATASDLANGIQWCADNGADVTSMSLGGPDSRTVERAIEYADGQGVLMTASAGNDGCSDCVRYPAAYSEVIAVAATDENDRVARFSSQGPEVELSAPGVDILTTSASWDSGYSWSSGTSPAAAQVAAVATLAMSQAPGLNADEVRTHLQQTAEDLGPSGRDAATGYGLVRADRLLDTLAPAAPANLDVSTDGTPGILELSWTTPDDPGAGSIDGYEIHRRAVDPDGTIRSDDGSAEGTLPFDGSSDTAVKVLHVTDPMAFEDGSATLWIRASASDCSAFAGSYRVVVNDQTATPAKNACKAWGSEAAWAGFEISSVWLESGENRFDLQRYASPTGTRSLLLAVDEETTAGSSLSANDVTLDGEPLWALGSSGQPPAIDEHVTTTGTSTSYTDSGLDEGATYTYRIQASSTTGTGPRTSQASAVTGPFLPGALGALSAQPGSSLGTVDLAWQAPADDGGVDILEYRVYQGPSPDALVHVATVDGSQTSYTDDGLATLTPTAYHYAVTAVNRVGEGPASDTVCTTAAPYDSLEQIASACDL